MKSNLIEKVREANPLIHNITNLVVANDSANGLLAIGASPFMSNTVAEVAEIQSFNGALVLNMGTINEEQVTAMIEAGKAANQQRKPVVIDPVGAGATAYRKTVIAKLLSQIKPTLIRGNAGELAAIAGIPWTAKGVDAGSGSASLTEIAKKVADSYHCFVLISGETDVITDGKRTYLVENGTPDFTKMTGSGCLLSCVCGAFLAVVSLDDQQAVFESLIAAATSYAVAGQLVAKETGKSAVGSFRTGLLDALSVIDSPTVAAHARGGWGSED